MEAIVHSASKKDKCAGLLNDAVPVLKKLYQESIDAVKVRALVVSTITSIPKFKMLKICFLVNLAILVSVFYNQINVQEMIIIVAGTL